MYYTSKFLLFCAVGIFALLAFDTKVNAQFGSGQLFAYDIKNTTTTEPNPFPVTFLGPITGTDNVSSLSYTQDFTGSSTTIANVSSSSSPPDTRYSISFQNNTGSSQNYEFTFSFNRNPFYTELYFRQLSFGYLTFNDSIYYELFRGTSGDPYAIRLDGGDGTGMSSSGNNDGSISATASAWGSINTTPLKVTGMSINPDAVIPVSPVTVFTLRFVVPNNAALTISNIEVTGRSVLPEPGSWALVVIGIFGTFWFGRRRFARMHETMRPGQ